MENVIEKTNHVLSFESSFFRLLGSCWVALHDGPSAILDFFLGHVASLDLEARTVSHKWHFGQAKPKQVPPT